MVSYLLFALILGPYLKRTHGMGINAIETNPRRLLAQSMPSFSYTKGDLLVIYTSYKAEHIWHR